MTGRGRGPTPPPIPIDESLLSRPVPRRKAFATRAFGPGSAADLQTRAYTQDMHLADRRAEGPIGGPGGRNGFISYPDLDDVRNLLENIDKWADCDFHDDEREPGPVDRTWGYYVFLTSYDAATRAKVEQAMENWVRVVERFLATQEGPDKWKEELRIRFKLELVEDEEALAGASDDRVRENFRSLMRNLDLRPEEDRWLPQARYSVCLAIDAAAVGMLAGLEILDKDPRRATDGLRYLPLDPDVRRELSTFRNSTVKAVDPSWDREGEAGSYRGVGQLSIDRLQQMYLCITRDACNKAMEDFHPLDGWPGR